MNIELKQREICGNGELQFSHHTGMTVSPKILKL